MGARVFAVVAACVLSVVAGQPDYDRATRLAAVAAARGTTPVAAAAERRLSADSCEDSQTWRHTDGKGKTRTCAWVGGKPLKRCKVKDEAEVSARDACPAACDTCPADGEDGEPSCADSTTWHRGSSKRQTCAWVAKSPGRHCDKESKDRVAASVACPLACGTCPTAAEGDATPAPTYAPTASPTPEPTPEPHDAKPSSAIKIKKLSPIFGARVVSGFDTATPASAEEAATLRSLILEHKLLVLPGGDLSAEQLAALGRSLGLGPAQAFGAKALAPYMKVVAKDVLALEYGPESPRADINLWHQDHSWRGAPTRFELSYAAVSPLGGDVLYADAVAAHASLSPRLRPCATNSRSRTTSHFIMAS